MIAIRIKLDKNEIKSLLNILTFFRNQCKPETVWDLVSHENTCKIVEKLKSRTVSHRDRHAISLSLTETITLQAFGEAAYSKVGSYESAVWHRINIDLQKMINREIQLRMI